MRASRRVPALEDGTDRGVLVVAPRRLAAGVARKERAGGLGLQTEAHRLLVAGAKLGRRGELAQRPRAGRLLGDFVVYDERVAVRGEGEKDVEAAAHGVGLGLLEPVRRWQMLGLRLEECDRYGLAGRVDLDSERVVNATLRPPAGTLTDHLDCPGRLFAADQILGPAACVQLGIDQLRASIGLTERHASRSIVYGHKMSVWP